MPNVSYGYMPREDMDKMMSELEGMMPSHRTPTFGQMIGSLSAPRLTRVDEHTLKLEDPSSNSIHIWTDDVSVLNNN